MLCFFRPGPKGENQQKPIDGLRPSFSAQVRPTASRGRFGEPRAPILFPRPLIKPLYGSNPDWLRQSDYCGAPFGRVPASKSGNFLAAEGSEMTKGKARLLWVCVFALSCCTAGAQSAQQIIQ